VTQLRKNVLLMGGLAVVAGGLALFAYFGVSQSEEKESTRKEAESRLFGADPGAAKGPDGGAGPAPEVATLVVKAKGDVTALEKKDGAWRITDPVRAPADPVAVDQVITALTTGKFKDLIEENPTDADLAKYGLAKPAWEVTAYAYLPVKREVTLQGGVENTFDGSIYVRRGGEKSIHSMEGGTRWSLEKSTFELRAKDVFSFDEAKLDRIELKSAKNAWTVERDPAKAWRLVKPTAEAADTATVQGIFTALKNERALAFPKEAIGNQAPVLEAGLGAGSELTRLRLFKQDKLLAVIDHGGESLVAEAPEAVLTALDKSVQELRDKTVVAFKREDVARVTLAKKGAPAVTVERVEVDGGPEDWKVSAPEAGPAKKWKLSSVLWNLSTLKAAELGVEHPKSWGGAYGLEPGERTVEIFDAAGKSLARLAVGKPVEGKPNLLFVRGSRDQVLEVDGSRLSDLPVTLADLLDKPPPPAAPSDAGPVEPRN